MAGIVVMFFGGGGVILIIPDGTFSGAAMMDTPFGG
jgi:hypothetical protein